MKIIKRIKHIGNIFVVVKELFFALWCIQRVFASASAKFEFEWKIFIPSESVPLGLLWFIQIKTHHVIHTVEM